MRFHLLKAYDLDFDECQQLLLCQYADSIDQTGAIL
jgi:hypothetical protein